MILYVTKASTLQRLLHFVALSISLCSTHVACGHTVSLQLKPHCAARGGEENGANFGSHEVLATSIVQVHRILRQLEIMQSSF